MTDPLDACRARWRDAPPLTRNRLRGILVAGGNVDRLVAEVLRLQQEHKRLVAEILLLREEVARLQARDPGLPFTAAVMRGWVDDD